MSFFPNQLRHLEKYENYEERTAYETRSKNHIARKETV